MKVNTDGVLLGAWATIRQDATHILDIGTGTGVLALMAAQRQPTAQIHAVEIEPEAAQQAIENSANSSFADRIAIYAESIQQFAQRLERHALYQHIWSNPPYYPEAQHLAANSNERQLARSTIALSFEDLLAAVSVLLHPTGICSLVIPIEIEAQLLQIAAAAGLYAQRVTHVIPRANKPANRLLIEFGKQPHDKQYSSLTIRNAGIGYHDYTDNYIQLLKNFYTIF